jgi:hypothetical protein
MYAQIMVKVGHLRPAVGSGLRAHKRTCGKLESIVPRLYLSARMIMDVSLDKVK